MNTFLKYRTLHFNTKRFKAFGLVLFLSFSGVQITFGQGSLTSEYQVKAVFLYNFTQFVEWPNTAFKSHDDPFVIGIMGDDPFGTYLIQTVAGEKMMGHAFAIQQVQDIKEAQHCHILFINSGDSKQIRETLTTLAGRNTLTVGDTGNFVRMGGMIRFFIQDNKIKLQINPVVAKSAGLNISSKLLRLAEIIH